MRAESGSRGAILCAEAGIGREEVFFMCLFPCCLRVGVQKEELEPIESSPPLKIHQC